MDTHFCRRMFNSLRSALRKITCRSAFNYKSKRPRFFKSRDNDNTAVLSPQEKQDGKVHAKPEPISPSRRRKPTTLTEKPTTMDLQQGRSPDNSSQKHTLTHHHVTLHALESYTNHMVSSNSFKGGPGLFQRSDPPVVIPRNGGPLTIHAGQTHHHTRPPLPTPSPGSHIKTTKYEVSGPLLRGMGAPHSSGMDRRNTKTGQIHLHLRTRTCWACGKMGHSSRFCSSPDPNLPFKSMQSQTQQLYNLISAAYALNQYFAAYSAEL